MIVYKKISELTAGTTPDGTELVEAVQSSATVSLTLDQLRELMDPPGFIKAYGGATAPSGYLTCDGSAVSRTTYANLFTAIGTTWGVGDGSTTFNIPNLQGAMLRGTGSQSAPITAGLTYTGPSVGAFQEDQMQGHYHSMNRQGIGIAGGTAQVGVPVLDVDNIGAQLFQATAPGSDGTNGTPRTGDETRPFNAGVTYCIKT